VVASGYPPLTVGGIQGALVAEICRALDGIPLAIELAAGSVSAFGLPENGGWPEQQNRTAMAGQAHGSVPTSAGCDARLSYHLLNDGERRCCAGCRRSQAISPLKRREG
jgi:hypothetical protein